MARSSQGFLRLGRTRSLTLLTLRARVGSDMNEAANQAAHTAFVCRLFGFYLASRLR